MHGSLAWQASAANISECDLALIPLLYPLDLNNGPRANLPSSVTVNLRARSAEFNRAAQEYLARKSRKNVPLEDPLSFYLNSIYTRNERKGHLPICRTRTWWNRNDITLWSCKHFPRDLVKFFSHFFELHCFVSRSSVFQCLINFLRISLQLFFTLYKFVFSYLLTARM